MVIYFYKDEHGMLGAKFCFKNQNEAEDWYDELHEFEAEQIAEADFKNNPALDRLCMALDEFGDGLKDVPSDDVHTFIGDSSVRSCTLAFSDTLYLRSNVDFDPENIDDFEVVRDGRDYAWRDLTAGSESPLRVKADISVDADIEALKCAFKRVFEEN